MDDGQVGGAQADQGAGGVHRERAGALQPDVGSGGDAVRGQSPKRIGDDDLAAEVAGDADGVDAVRQHADGQVAAFYDQVLDGLVERVQTGGKISRDNEGEWAETGDPQVGVEAAGEIAAVQGGAGAALDDVHAEERGNGRASVARPAQNDGHGLSGFSEIHRV